MYHSLAARPFIQCMRVMCAFATTHCHQTLDYKNTICSVHTEKLVLYFRILFVTFRAIPFMAYAIFQTDSWAMEQCDAQRPMTKDTKVELLTAHLYGCIAYIQPSGHRAKHVARVSERTVEGKMELWWKYIRDRVDMSKTMGYRNRREPTAE